MRAQDRLTVERSGKCVCIAVLLLGWPRLAVVRVSLDRRAQGGVGGPTRCGLDRRGGQRGGTAWRAENGARNTARGSDVYRLARIVPHQGRWWVSSSSSSSSRALPCLPTRHGCLGDGPSKTMTTIHRKAADESVEDSARGLRIATRQRRDLLLEPRPCQRRRQCAALRCTVQYSRVQYAHCPVHRTVLYCTAQDRTVLDVSVDEI